VTSDFKNPTGTVASEVAKARQLRVKIIVDAVFSYVIVVVLLIWFGLVAAKYREKCLKTRDMVNKSHQQ